MSTPLDRFLSEWAPYKRHGKEYRVRCTGKNHHRGDKNPSLDVCEGSNGKLLFNCRSQHCEVEDILSGKGWTMRDLYDRPLPKINGNKSYFKSDTERDSLLRETSLTQHFKRFPRAIEIEARINESDELNASVRRMSEIQAEIVNWLWEPYVPLGMFTLIEGIEGAGKTWLLLAIATSVSLGRGLRGITENHPKGPVLLIMTEDSPAHVIKPRLDLMGADMDQILIHSEPFALDTLGGISKFKAILEKYKPILVIFDPIFACTSGKLNLNADNEIRTVTSPLKSLAEEFGCAIVGVRHVGKGKGGGDPRAAGLNGVGWRAAARSVLLVGVNQQNEAERGVVQTKCNLTATSSKTLGFTITHEGFGWLPESRLTASSMLAAFVHENHSDISEREEAISFLQDLLQSGPVDQKTIDKERESAGISVSTLRRAKAQLGVKSRKAGSGPWEWSL